MSKENKGFWGSIFGFIINIFSFIKKTILVIWKTFHGIIFILGLIVFISIFVRVNTVYKHTKEMALQPKDAVLYIDFSESISEVREDELISDLTGGNNIAFYDLISGIEKATKDDNIKALVVDTSGFNLDLAQTEEVRRAVKKFRSNEKKTYIYSVGFGSFSGGMSHYYLASAFDEIWIQPVSQIGITGINIEIPFFKNVLDKIGVEPEFYGRYEYKSAISNLLENEMTAEHREDITKIASSLFEHIVMEISKDRNIEKETLLEMINNAPILIGTDVDNSLVDFVDYKPELVAKVSGLYGPKVIGIEDYISYKNHFERLKIGRKEDAQKKSIAYLALDGVINDGVGKNKFGQSNIYSKDTVKEIDAIMKDENVIALVIRVNSPGGSYSASNEIWYAINKLKEQRNIPVVVSMGGTAASGGYFIALAGDEIYANNMTLTGSIGVFGGKASFQKLWEKIGINWENISIGENSAILSSNKKFTQKELDIFNRSLDDIYIDFTTKVSKSRKISLEDLDLLARGRVWTGSLSSNNKLIDNIGGIVDAIDRAAELASLKDEEYKKEDGYKVVYYPRKKTFQEKLEEVMSENRGMIPNVAIFEDLGLDISEINMLKSLKHDTIMMPLKIYN